MEAIKIKCPVVGRVFKAAEFNEFLAVNARLRYSDYEYEMRIFWNGKNFAGGIIVAATKPRDEVKAECFLRLSNYELSELPRPLRILIKHHDNAINCTIRRTRGGTTYETRFDQGGYNIAVAAASLSELKTKFIEAAIVAENGATN